MSSPEAYRRLYDLEGTIAFIAGGAGGIGIAIAEGLAAFGATAVIADILRNDAAQAAEGIRADGGKSVSVELDVLDVPGLEGVVQEVTDTVGVPDVLVNCIGSHREAPAETYREDDWDFIVDLNLKGAFFLSQALAKAQITRGVGGKHIHITSVRSLLGIHRGYSSYCSSKGGLNSMVRQLATEWGKYNITVNAIAPTFTRTDLVKQYLEDPDFYNPLVARIPLHRVCEPVDLAGLAIYLAAPASNFITGQIIFADGGLTAAQ
jgi:NAD(P)-dependent dehydrogenase (short-subunit alcohol dehydrogenase family)